MRCSTPSAGYYFILDPASLEVLAASRSLSELLVVDTELIVGHHLNTVIGYFLQRAPRELFGIIKDRQERAVSAGGVGKLLDFSDWAAIDNRDRPSSRYGRLFAVHVRGDQIVDPASDVNVASVVEYILYPVEPGRLESFFVGVGQLVFARALTAATRAGETGAPMPSPAPDPHKRPASDQPGATVDLPPPGGWNKNIWYYEMAGMRFPDLAELNRAIDLLADSRLKGMPVKPPGRCSLLVPKVAVEVFRAAGLRFTEERVENPSGKPV